MYIRIMNKYLQEISNVFYLLTTNFTLCNYFYCVAIVINQPSNVTTCEGKGAVFTCVLNTTNTNIRDDDVQWYRFIKNTGTTETVDPDEDNINLLTHATENILNSSLSINDVKESYTGYYWMGTPFSNVCNVSLNVLTSM